MDEPSPELLDCVHTNECLHCAVFDAKYFSANNCQIAGDAQCFSGCGRPRTVEAQSEANNCNNCKKKVDTSGSY